MQAPTGLVYVACPRPTLGRYPELAKLAHERIAGSTLIEFPDAGHAPQMQDPAAFHKALLKGLADLKPQQN